MMRVATYLLAAAFLAASDAHTQGAVTAPLHSGPRTLDSASTAAFVDSLVRSSGAAVHGLARLVRPPTAADRARLVSRGLTIVSPLGRVLYRVAVAPRFARGVPGLRDTVLALALLRPEDKVSRALWGGSEPVFRSMVEGPDTVAVDSAGAVGVLASMYLDADPSAVATAWATLGIAAMPIGQGRWRAQTTPAQVRTFAQHDFVRWVEQASRVQPALDVVRQAVHLDAVQPTFLGIAQGLTGKDVDVGVFDFGIDETHVDFNALDYCGWMVGYCAGPSRIVVNDAGVSAHGTHQAGVIAGTGRNSALADSWGLSNGGSAFQWRGLAPGARLIDAAVLDGAMAGNQHLVHFVTVHGLDVSNHSYPLSVDGAYNLLTVIHDDVIRGDHVVGVQVVPPRLHVHSAGNAGTTPAVTLMGSSYYYDGHQLGYFALRNQAKNALVVGNYNTTAGRIATSSSLGPTHDGRIKPDIVAPGTTVRAPGYCKDGDVGNNPIVSGTLGASPVRACDGRTAPAPPERRQFYFPATGTSTAAAVVSGVLAVVLEAYAREFDVDLDVTPPLPSTLRAITVHAAEDIEGAAWYTDDGSLMTVPDGAAGPIVVRAFPGPDFTTGYGLIDAQRAVEVVRSRAVIEGRVEADCHVRSYRFYVSESEPGDVRVTLAWDDPASDPALAPEAVHLLNDLDLTLLDPAGNRHYPWKLNQQVVDAGGAGVADEAQACGTDVTVERFLHPASAPVFLGPGNPGNLGDKLLESNLGPAGRGRDHLNNLEQVQAPAMAGWWKAEVGAFRLQAPDQPFSLVGVPRRTIVGVSPEVLCRLWEILCRDPLHFLCRRYPMLCERTQRIPFATDTLFLTGPDTPGPLLMPLTTACQALGSRESCGPSDLGWLTLTVGPAPVPIRVSVITGGEPIATRDVARAERATIRLPPGTGIPRFLLIEPRESHDRDIPVPLRITRASR